VSSARAQLATIPLVPRLAVVGAVSAGVIGGLVGLVLGLRAYPATAWFAVIEVAVPAAALGAALGALAGLVGVVARRRTQP
jgi:hypothetical protein